MLNKALIEVQKSHPFKSSIRLKTTNWIWLKYFVKQLNKIKINKSSNQAEQQSLTFWKIYNKVKIIQ